MADPLNSSLAQRFREVAQLLQEQGANPFRLQAYRHAADTLDHLDRPVSSILDMEGPEGLRKLPGIGASLARAIQEVVKTGRLPMLDRLRGETDPITLLSSVPGIGKSLAERLHHDLGIDTLEQLETAAHDSRLSTIEGIGPKKLAGIIDSLASRLGRVRTQGLQTASLQPTELPAVSELLDVDQEYRTKAEAGLLHRIAPRRFNPTAEAWLPILHTQRDHRHYHALFSNTARAHQRGKTRDWVVLYYDDGHHEHQCTVITASRGPLIGKRVIAGREQECEVYYESVMRHA